MKFLVGICLISCVFCFHINAQVGDRFPSLEGRSLTEKNIAIPTGTTGKVTLLGIAYSRKSDKLLKDWLNPVYQTFIEPPQSIFMPSEPYDINLYFIGMLSGLKKAATGKVETVLNKKLDSRLQEYTVLSKVKLKVYKQALGLGKKDLPYFFVLDEDGTIIYKTEGAYTETKLQKILDIVDQNSL